MDYEDYLDPDEEFELMHADEMELLGELNPGKEFHYFRIMQRNVHVEYISKNGWFYRKQ